MIKPYVLLGLLALSSFSITGCSLGSNEVNFDRYTLTLDVDPNTYLSDSSVDLTLAPVLDQGGVVLQMSDVTLRPAKNYRYSTDLDKELRWLFINELLKTNLLERFGGLNTAVYVSKFQGTVDGLALVAFSVQVSDKKSNKVLFQKSYSSNTNIEQDGYSALVTELKNGYITEVNNFISEFSAKSQAKASTKAKSKAKSK